MAKKGRLVVKVGSRVLTEKGSLCTERIDNLVNLFQALHKEYELLFVSSGAVAAGHTKVPEISNDSTANKQALAAIGQAELIHTYQERFAKYGIHVAQILLTKDDFANFRHSENAQNAVNTLLEKNILPIINENDSVVIDELLRGDNDQLSAQVAHYFKADLLAILTDIEGYYTDNPHKNPDARLRKVVHSITPEELEQEATPHDKFATGGIVTKLKAAAFLLEHGTPTYLGSGFDLTGVRKFLLEGIQETGTLFTPERNQ